MRTNSNKHSFCPAKWQDRVYDPIQNYLCGCSKAPGYTEEEYFKQRDNMMNGIQDPSCNYCWDTEKNHGTSLRMKKLAEWDGTLDLNRLDINIGSLCNMQCTYCSPRVSTKWQNDISKHGFYNIEFNTAQYNVDEPQENEMQVDKIIDYVNKNKPKRITILGGEPLINPHMPELLDRLELEGVILEIPTNLCYTNERIIEKLGLISRFNRVIIKPSLDTVNKEVCEYIRYGSDLYTIKMHTDWILNSTHMEVEFLSLMTAHTIWDIIETYGYVTNLNRVFPGRVVWCPEYLKRPIPQSFDIFNDRERDIVLNLLNDLGGQRISIIRDAVRNSVYNEKARIDQINFLSQFNERHGIETPDSLKFLMKI